MGTSGSEWCEEKRVRTRRGGSRKVIDLGEIVPWPLVRWGPSLVVNRGLSHVVVRPP